MSQSNVSKRILRGKTNVSMKATTGLLCFKRSSNPSVCFEGCPMCLSDVETFYTSVISKEKSVF